MSDELEVQVRGGNKKRREETDAFKRSKGRIESIWNDG